MVNATNCDDIAPISLILPSIPFAKQSTAAPTGTIGMSGATIVFFNGSAWKYLAGT